MRTSPSPHPLVTMGNFIAVKNLNSILEANIDCSETAPEASALVIDDSAFINLIPPKTSRTFVEYASDEVIRKVQVLCYIHRRTDIVLMYTGRLFLNLRREQRGQGARLGVTDTGKFPSNWRSFLRDINNKTDLFSLQDYSESYCYCL